jgi:hypothetical protein
MTTSIRRVTSAHQGLFDIRVVHNIRLRTTRMREGTEAGEFEIGPYGVTVHGKLPGIWTLIPWSNIASIEPTT